MNSVLIDSAEKFNIDPVVVRRTVKEFLGQKRLGKKVEVSIFFVKPSAMRKLNRDYRKIDQPTTVLTFSQQSGQEQVIPDKILRLGDIVVCPKIAQKQNLKISFLLRHGLKSLLSEISTPEDKRIGFG